MQDSQWDRIRLFFFNFFHNDIIDLSQDKYTQGFGDGYRTGFLHGSDAEKERVRTKEDLLSGIL